MTIIQSYSSDWPEKYQKEADLIKEVLSDVIIDIQHIGSTAIPELSAKPIIDIAVLTSSISDPSIFVKKLEKIGYSYKSDMSSAERIFLRKGDPVEFHLSISESKYSYWERQILFRDYLRNNSEAVKEYEGLKEEALKGLSEEELKDLSKSEKYNSKKGPFIEKILKLATYTEKIKLDFPDVEYKSAKVITHGWDNDVVILDDSFVFRFPRNDEYKERFKSEVDLLKFLKDKIKVSIPEYKYLSQDKSFGGYPIIAGTELRPELFESLSDEIKEQIFKDLANFITTLHETPKDIVEKIGIATPDDYDWSPAYTRDIYGRIKEKLFPILAKEEIDWIEYQFNHYFSLKGEIKRVLIHNDLADSHIFFNKEKKKISGIIDFADADYADSALDFSRLLEYGEDFMRKVIGYYQGFKDEDLIQRAKFKRLVGMVGNMLVLKEDKQMQTTFDEQRLQLHKKMKLFPIKI